MKEFEVRVSKIRSVIHAETGLCQAVQNVEEQVSSIRNSLSINAKYAMNIKRTLNSVINQIAEEKHSLKKMSEVLRESVDKYEDTERRITQTAADGKVSRQEEKRGNTLSNFEGNLFDWEQLKLILFPKFPSINPVISLLDLLLINKVTTGFLSNIIKNTTVSAEFSLDEQDAKFEVTGQGKHNLYDGKDKKILVEEKYRDDGAELEKLDKVAQVSVTAGVEASLASAKLEVKGENASISASADVLKGEVYASGYAGLYSIDSDGKKRFTPGIGGEVGASVTALSVDAEAQLGNDNLGAYVKGNITAGKVSAQASGNIGLVDAEGNFNPQAHMNISAEAIAAEASATVGAKVLGVDVSGKASVNVGIGAHADIGYKDGKLSVDIGASLGLGVSVDLDIDIGKAVDNVATGISNVTDNACKWLKGWLGW
ncbi:MAG: hypothetical protein IKM28_05735 [Lachnospiraceae bacterium]|nr:hypothetical protein [Lachnospiraceae bacterium]